jgi:hypothetical protein
MRHTWRWADAVVVDREKLSAVPGVVAVAVGFKERGGRVTRRVAVKIYVTRKRAKVAKAQRVPKSTLVVVPGRGQRTRRLRVPTDVIRLAPIELCAGPSDVWTPVPGGAYLWGTGPGTFACRVRDAHGNTRGLSVSHLFVNASGALAANRPVSQPRDADLGVTTTGHYGNVNGAFVDYALFTIDPRNASSVPLDGLSAPAGVMPASAITGTLAVTKYGATTLRTSGQLVTHLPAVVVNGLVVLNVYEFRSTDASAFADLGDSGALVGSTQPGSVGRVVGLLFAVSKVGTEAEWRAYVFPFDRIPGIQLA